MQTQDFMKATVTVQPLTKFLILYNFILLPHPLHPPCQKRKEEYNHDRGSGNTHPLPLSNF